MKKYLFISMTIIIIILNFSCSFMESPLDIVRVDSLTVYNCDFDSMRCGLMLNDTLGADIADKDNAHIIISSYFSNNIVLISPHRDTSRFKANSSKTGLLDVGQYLYYNAPQDGYYDMEYPVRGHYYFFKHYLSADSCIYGRIYINYFDWDSMNINIEISREGRVFEKGN